MAKRVTYRKIPVQRSDGVIQRQKVRSDRLEDYGRVVTNNRGRVAYVKKSSEVRALEIVRGEGASLRRVRLVFKGKYPVGGDEEARRKRRQHKLQLEADLTVTVPAEDLADFKEQLLQWVTDQAERFGLDAEDWRVDEERNEPAVGGLVGVEVADVIFRNKSNPAATGALRSQAQAILADYEGAEGEPDDEEAEAIQRAVQATDKRGRTYWYDPETGRRTLSPELIR